MKIKRKISFDDQNEKNSDLISKETSQDKINNDELAECEFVSDDEMAENKIVSDDETAECKHVNDHELAVCKHVNDEETTKCNNVNDGLGEPVIDFIESIKSQLLNSSDKQCFRINLRFIIK